MKNIVLCGMMGCGKTTCAHLLGTQLGRPVVDTDDMVVEMAGMSISDLFAQKGEAAMRDLETEAARQLSTRQDLIIATGGGLPLRSENRQLLRRTGIVVFLRRDPARSMTQPTCLVDPWGSRAGTHFFPDSPSVSLSIGNFPTLSFRISPAGATVAEILTKLEGQL